MKKNSEHRKLPKLFIFTLILCEIFFRFPAVIVAQRETHRHPNSFDAMEIVASEIEIIEVKLHPNVEKAKIVGNRKYKVFTTYEKKNGHRIFFVEPSSKRIYEIRGVPLGWRPFSDLVWLNNRTLAFDRWSNPHHGSHYEIDARARKLKRALIFNGTNLVR